MNLKKSNKKFISIIWGYHTQIFDFHKEQNYHMMPFEVMMEQGYECELFAIDSRVNISDDPHFIKGVKVTYYKNILSYLLYLYKNRENVIYSNSLTIKTLLVGLIGKNTFFYPHDNIFGRTGKNIIKICIIKFFYRFFTKIRINNTDEKKALDVIRKGLGYICPLPISADFYSDKKQNRSDAVFIGNLTSAKNPEFLIDTCKILRDRKIHFQIHIIGEDRYSKNGRNFSDLVQENNLESSMILHGFLEPKEIKKRLHKSLIYINTSLGEGQCLAVYEGALAGNILCLPNIMSFPSVFHKNAFYHNNPQGLADNIMNILQDTQKYQKSIEKTQKMIGEKYSYETIKKQLTQLFDER
ncbi:glycosyltransferase [Candidatus Gracilibacteria bacterium]|nr:glycosyltransferase [Candidatus Gracilibacteria bacterium]